MSGINTGAYPIGAVVQDWASVEALANALNSDLVILQTDVNTLQDEVQNLAGDYTAIIDAIPPLIANTNVYSNAFQQIYLASPTPIVSGAEVKICDYEYGFAPNVANPAMPVAFIGGYLCFNSIDGVSNITRIEVNLRQGTSTTILQQGYALSEVNNAGYMTCSFAFTIINNTGSTLFYNLSVKITSAGNTFLIPNSNTWLLPMSAPTIPA